ncbi:MAG TPA: hypothetical protein VFK05_20710 [Polyangiaceae bacterium]|nr:hypothetical protein [Polyangiaceae bacterium]
MGDSTLLWALVALAIVALAIILLLASRHRAKARRAELKSKFGPEYDRAVEEYGPERADRELASRERRVGHFQAHELPPADRERFLNRWTELQARFVDDPGIAVAGADDLINEVLRARGYPSADFEQRVADLSVEHAPVLQHYRAAQALAESNRNGLSNTEELRQALVHYRVLFADLLAEPKARAGLHQAHA